MKIRNFFEILSNYYFFIILFGSVVFVFIISFYKLFIEKPTYIYAKVKVGQGLWWAVTQKPPFWYVKKISNLKGKIEKDLSGKPLTEVISVRFYPSGATNQYDVYIIMKLKVKEMSKTSKFSYKRSTIGVGSPVDFEFPEVQFSGTIIELSKERLKDTTVTKTIILAKKNVYEWEYNSIEVGSKYFDGEENIFEIIEKGYSQSQKVKVDAKNNILGGFDTVYDIYVKAKIKVKSVDDDNYVYGEDKLIKKAQVVDFSTNDLFLQDYIVVDIE